MLWKSEVTLITDLIYKDHKVEADLFCNLFRVEGMEATASNYDHTDLSTRDKEDYWIGLYTFLLSIVCVFRGDYITHKAGYYGVR